MMRFVSLNNDLEVVERISQHSAAGAPSFFDELVLPAKALMKLFNEDAPVFSDMSSIIIERSDDPGSFLTVTDTLYDCRCHVRGGTDEVALINELRLHYETLWGELRELIYSNSVICFTWRSRTLNVGQDLDAVKALASLFGSIRSGLFVLYLHSDVRHPFRVEGNLLIAGLPDAINSEVEATTNAWKQLFSRITPHLNMVDRFTYRGMVDPVSLHELDKLPNVLEYFGEFGAELVLFIPFIAWASSVGLMTNRTVLTYKGMQCFYDDLQLGGYVEKDENRVSVEAKFRPYYLPIKDEHTWDWALETPFHLYRDYRTKFRTKGFELPHELLSKPVLIIHNKYNDEYGRGAINNISLAALELIVNGLKSEFSIVYIRHGMSPVEEDYSIDHNTFLEYDDKLLLSRHPEVFIFDDLYRTYGFDRGMNEFKSYLYSKTYHVIASQGGGSFQCASYPGGVIVVFHRFGNEMHRAYTDGFFRSLSNPAPILLICLDQGDISLSIEILKHSSIVADRVCFDEKAASLIGSLLPIGQKRRYEANDF